MDARLAMLMVGVCLTTVQDASGQSSLYGQQVNTCSPKENGFYNTATTMSGNFKPQHYGARLEARSEIECAMMCRREGCTSAYWLESSRMCYLSNYTLHAMTKFSNRALHSQTGSLVDGTRMLAIHPDLLNVNKPDTSAECAATSCDAGSHTCRKDCTNNIGVCVAKLTECDEIPVSNIRHWYWTNFNTELDNGNLVSVTYKKQHDETSLRVKFRATLRTGYNQENGCCRWYYTFNGQECASPGPIEVVWWRAVSVDYYRPSRVDGICNNFPAGDVNVKVNVMPCSGYSGNCRTGFGGQNLGVSLTIEENDIRHGFGNNLETYGGNANGASCVFPFVYDGKSHSACTNVNHNQLWCATTSSYDTDGKWGHCPGTCPGLSRFNIMQYAWNEERSENNAHLYSFNYYKRDPATAIHVIYISNMYYYGQGTVRYTIKFNGNDCSSPGVIDGLFAHLDSNVVDENYDGSNAITGMCDNIGAGQISVQIHIQQWTLSPECHTGWKQMSRLIIEEIRYDQDVSAVMTPDGKLHRLPEHNIHQWWWWALNDETDVGHIGAISVTYVKQSSLSQLRVYYQGDIRQLKVSHEYGPGCSRWYLTFNGNECSSPGPIAGLVYQYLIYNSATVEDNHHHVSVIDGFCNLPAGSYNIRMYVQTCSGYSENQAYTCWNSGCRLIAEEVFTADW